MGKETGKIKILQNEVDLLTKEKEAFERNGKIFQALVETAVGDIGQAFFNNIVKKLSEWLNAECVIIGQIVRDNVVEGFPMYLDGEIKQGFTYTLRGTPCDLTSKKGYCVYTDEVIKSFPTSKDLIDINAKGYVGTALYDKNGEPSGILCAISRKKLNLPPQTEDIMRIVGSRVTAEIERIKAQKALEKSEENIRNANASKDRFFSIISHDLKSPINLLLGYSEILLEDVKNNKYNEILNYIHQIHDVSNQTYNLLQNLLEWSLNQTGNISFNPEHIYLSILLNESIELLNSFAQQKNITLIAEIDPEIKVYADKNMITTIVRNLVSNAMKYSEEGGEITISAISDNDKTKMSVKDLGVGISPQNMEKLFKIENSISTIGTNNEKGSGLGLILCKEFVKRHNGDIWAESEQGKGSIFSFTIGRN